MELDCKFYNSADEYTCFVTSSKTEKDSNLIKGVNCSHHEGKCNKDVQSIFFINNNVMNFIPLGVIDFFPNLVELVIIKCALKTISRKDLKEFKNLEILFITNNELTALPEDLFEDTKKLVKVSFYANKIESMSSKLFQPIIKNNLTYIDFRGNAKIHAFYAQPNSYDSVATVADLMRIIDTRCLQPQHSEDQTTNYLSEIYQKTMPKGFEKLYSTGKFSDFVITVNDSKEFKVHKSVIAAQCEGFSELLGEDPDAHEMKIEDLSTEAVEKFLRFLYTGKLENFADNCLEIYALASKFNALELKDSIEKFIINNLQQLDALKAFKLSHSFQSEALRIASFQTIQNNFSFLNLPDDLINDYNKVKEMFGIWKSLNLLVKDLKPNANEQ